MTKEQSNIVKGFAILLMLVHHFFTFPQWIMGGGVHTESTICKHI